MPGVEPGLQVNALDIALVNFLVLVKFLVEGNSNDDIASQLTISPKTVARHRENIMHKLNLHSRAELVRYAIRKGIIKA